MNRTVIFEDWQHRDYHSSWAAQEALLEAIASVKVANRSLPPEAQVPTENYLFFVEHPPVFTLGKSGKSENLLQTPEELKSLGYDFVKTNRGGDITYHGPGQLVGYPVFDLDNFKPDIHWFMRTLEEAIILTCADFGLTAGRIEGLTGVWLGSGTSARKICAMGVKASRWITMHGFALNVSTDMAAFGHIVPCGIQDKAVTSLSQELGRQVALSEVAPIVKHNLANCFGITAYEV